MKRASDQRLRRILVIDDNEAIHDDFRKTLSRKSLGPDLDDDEALLFGYQPAETHPTEFEINAASQGHLGLELVEAAMRARAVRISWPSSTCGCLRGGTA